MSVRVTLRLSLDASGLVGGKAEYAPYFGVWGSFGKHREVKRIHLARKNDGRYENAESLTFSLDHGTDGVRGDETVWFHLFANTRLSGVEDIDRIEGAYEERNVQCGLASLSLQSLFALCQEQPHTVFAGKPLALPALPIMEDKLVTMSLAMDRAEHREPDVHNALEAGHKGTLYVTATIENLDASGLGQILAAMVPLEKSAGSNGTVVQYSSSTAGSPLLYTSKNRVHFEQTLSRFLDSYVGDFIGQTDAKTGRLIGPPKYNTRDKNIAGLHFALYQSPVGELPVVAYWAHLHSHRPYASATERIRVQSRYGLTAASEEFFKAMLTSACRRYGMSAESYTRAVQAQLELPLDATTVSDDYTLARIVTADFATFVANAAAYTSDVRYVNRAAKTNGAKQVTLESFDLVVQYLISISDDCEGDDNIASTMLRLLATGRTDLQTAGGWQSPMLKAAREICMRSVVFDMGGSVTAAYVGADGKALKKGELKDLPLMDSAEDRRNPSGGHSWGLWHNRATVAQWLARGGVTENSLLLNPGEKRFAAWEQLQRPLVLEGTGSIDPLVLPVAEVYAGGEESLAFRKADAAHKFVREILGDEQLGGTDLAEAFHPDAVSFYTKSVDRRRRVSTFYRKPIHAVSVELYQRHPGLSQVAFCDARTKERGLDLTTLLRDGFDKEVTGTVMLHAPFYERGAEWQAEMVPVIEAMLNQMPLASMGRIPEEENYQRPLYFGAMSERTFLAHLDHAKQVRGITHNAISLGAHSRAPDFRAPMENTNLPPVDAMQIRGGLDAALWKKLAAWRASNSLDTDEIKLAVGVESIRFSVPIDAKAAVAASGQRWADLDQAAPPTAFVGREGAARQFRVERVQVRRSQGVEFKVSLQTNIPDSNDALARPPTVYLLTLRILGRPFAGAPLVVAAQSGRRNESMQLLPGNVTAAGPWALAAHFDGQRKGLLHVRFHLPSDQHLAQYFATTKPVLATPWLTLDTPSPVPSIALVAQRTQMLSFDLGHELDVKQTSVFADCYKRDDVTLVRFFGKEWTFEKKRVTCLRALKTLYERGLVLAHEFVCNSPLPQCGDVIELHLLIPVK